MNLNARQKLFVQNLVKGMSQEQAYIKAGYAKKTARFNAARLITNANIQKYRAQLEKPKEDEAHMTRAMKRLRLYQIGMKSKDEANAIRAIKEDNLMTGEYEPQKLEINDLDRILQKIRSHPPRIPPRKKRND